MTSILGFCFKIRLDHFTNFERYLGFHEILQQTLYFPHQVNFSFPHPQLINYDREFYKRFLLLPPNLLDPVSQTS